MVRMTMVRKKRIKLFFFVICRREKKPSHILRIHQPSVENLRFYKEATFVNEKMQMKILLAILIISLIHVVSSSYLKLNDVIDTVNMFKNEISVKSP